MKSGSDGSVAKSKLNSMLVLEPVDYWCFLRQPKGLRVD